MVPFSREALEDDNLFYFFPCQPSVVFQQFQCPFHLPSTEVKTVDKGGRLGRLGRLHKLCCETFLL